MPLLKISQPVDKLPKVSEISTIHMLEASTARLRWRHRWILVSLVLCVVAPLVLSAIYLYDRAADQYLSRMGFSVRNEEAGSAFELLGNLTRVSGSSSSDTDILYQYIQSQELVLAVGAVLDLKAIWGKPRQDPVFRLPPDSSVEDLVDYWKSMVRVIYDQGTGLMEVQVRAFEPEDAQAIAQELLVQSGTMINRLSAVAREDLTRYAEEELIQAVGRLKEARQAVTVFRNETQIVDPGADLQGRMGLLNSLQEKLAESLIRLDLLVETVRGSDPRIAHVRRETDVIQNRIDEERKKLGVSGQTDRDAYADLVGKFESLTVDLEFAEEAYVSALSAYDAATAEARRQNRYLATFLRPTLAETAEHPKRETLLVLLALVLIGCWSVATMVFYSLKDRR